MDERRKPQPEPHDEPDVLLAALSRAGDSEFDDDLSISLVVSGGLPEQRYRFAFRTKGHRLAECSLDCELSHRHGKAAHERDIDASQLAALSQGLVRSGLLGHEAGATGFLPDTVIGVIEVAAGGAAHRLLFAADPDQAAVQGRTPPDAILMAADAIYRTAEQILDLESVRP